MSAGALRWMLSMPMEIEAVLEGLLGPRTLALPHPAKGQAAGDYVATLIQAEADRQARSPKAAKPYEAPASTIKRAAKVVEAAKTEVVPPRRQRSSKIADTIIRGQVKKEQAALAAFRSTKKRPPEPDEED